MSEKQDTGHRQRLRERFLAGKVETLSDGALLELLLTFAIERRDVRPVAEELIRIFGSLSQVLSASPDELLKVKGIGQSSVALLHLASFIQSGSVSKETITSRQKGAGAAQQKLFEDLMEGLIPEQRGIEPQSSMPERPEELSNSHRQLETGNVIPADLSVVDSSEIPRRPSQNSKKSQSDQENIPRKFQVSRSHILDFNHFSRVLSYLYENREGKRINRQLLIENLGLPDGQVASLTSIGAAMGLIQLGDQILTPTGLIIASHDVFLEKHGTLEWCHCKAAGSFQNLIWFEVFNHLLAEEPPMTQEGWLEYFRNKLKGQYTDKTIKDHVPKEVHFVLDAYMERNFSKLGLLHKTTDERIYRRRYTGFDPPILSAMIYDFCATNETRLPQVGEMAVMPGSPAVVFGLDVASFRQQIEGLHDRGWLRYETTHNLDQIRLKPGFSAMEFLTAHFEGREPRQNDDSGMMTDE